MEAVTLDLMYHIPSDESITECEITKDLVERMGGTIDFTSKEGEGTTFFLTIPYMPRIFQI